MSRKRRNSEPCFKCFDDSHPTDSCTDTITVSCLKCTKLNVSDKKCNCDNFRKPFPLMVLRLAGDPHAPRWFMDLEIHESRFVALVNPSITKGRVRRDVALWLTSLTKGGIDLNKESVTLKVTRDDLILRIPCDIVETQEHDINLGSDIMKFFGYTLTMEGVTLDSNLSYIAPSPYDLNYGYNLPGKGDKLRKYLQSKAVFLKPQRNIAEHYGVPEASPPKKRVINIGQPTSSVTSSDSDN